MAGAPVGIVGELLDALQQSVPALLLNDARRRAYPGRVGIVKTFPGSSDRQLRAIVHGGVIEVIQVGETIGVAGPPPVHPGKSAVGLSVSEPAAILEYEQGSPSGIALNVCGYVAPDRAPVGHGIGEAGLA